MKRILQVCDIIYNFISLRRLSFFVLLMFLLLTSTSSINDNCVYVLTKKINPNDPIVEYYASIDNTEVHDFNSELEKPKESFEKETREVPVSYEDATVAIAVNRYRNVKVPSEKNEKILRFINRWENPVRKFAKEFDLSYSGYMAVLILESQFGTSELAKIANNFAGIKCKGKNCEGDQHFTPELKEYVKKYSNTPYTHQGDAYFALDTPWLGVKFVGLFLKSRIESKHPFYQNLFKNNDIPESFAYDMLRCKWSETSDYDYRLIRIIRQYEL